ncbi:Gfo/Idh/MocA family protein [Paraburkholderia humisilvae]|uniref:Scyllo-inositol 2-dehydrogenase (NAD(+)) n=1 Tax=Paraburkholderia humisilvae TaxID=627669 RepID=A0A6J5D5K6_9BURK|nr:Gfo/Idh/MocA family oxidoreductase [Paraburkholderia humisilvae]CAB3749193.1 scyllo-inositol 2-dehydrogenase (NAD(+)) [Paraburkholderia humisilvae]
MTVRAAIVGLGRWGRRLTLSIQGSSKIQFVAGVTRRVGRAQEFADQVGIPLTNQLNDVITNPSIDAVVLATPHSVHASQVLKAVAARKHVLCEKPFTLDCASAARCIEAAQAAGVVLAVGMNRRFLPAVRDLVSRAHSGDLGTLLHVEANYSANAIGFYSEGSWRLDPVEVPCGGLAGLGIHMVDSMIELLGPVRSVVAVSSRRMLREIDDVTAVLFEFASGASASLTTSLATPMCWRLHAFGSAAHAELRGIARLEVTRRNDSPAQVFDYAPVDIERKELEAFADAVKGEAPFPVSLADAYHGVAVFEAIVRSASSGERVELDPVLAAS